MLMPKDSNLPNRSPRHSPIFILVTLLASLGAMNSAITGIWGFNPITYLLGKGTDLSEALYVLIGFCGFCLFAFDFKLLISRLFTKSDNNKIDSTVSSEVAQE